MGVVTMNRVNGVSTFNATLIAAAVATGNGEWIDAKGLKAYNIHTSGITTASVHTADCPTLRTLGRPSIKTLSRAVAPGP